MDAKEIRSIRDALGETQRGMAAWLGMSLTGYQKYEEGVRGIPGPVARLAKLLQDKKVREKILKWD